MVSPEEWNEAVKILAGALSIIKEEIGNYNYGVMGSGAYVLHGIKYDNPRDYPDDIDIATTHPRTTLETLESLHESGEITLKEEPDSGASVKRYKVTINTEKPFTVNVDLIHAEEFGIDSSILETKNDIQTTSLIETLKSIYHRPEHRVKDLIAFRDLIKNNMDTLQPLVNSPQFKKMFEHNINFRNAVKMMVDIFANPGKSKNDEYVDRAVASLLPSLTSEAKKIWDTEILLKQKEPHLAKNPQSLFDHHAQKSQAPAPKGPPSAAERRQARQARLERQKIEEEQRKAGKVEPGKSETKKMGY
ncbi:hypothetical protein AQUSIP_06410 [Aquicella siphonis]|uniref:Uncharacterized protein n=1 Tax=Aquicella siphonis TaxID=254247 RepID=A0A5E4PG52_9COXI|nr:hypothetical protein [Aquicella siphonis]VVC75351.1 hypothetical protein AQUSIP_06410 [Aquicella siphonis]